MEFSEIVSERCSVRDYSDRPVDKAVLNSILEAGRCAPTAKNSQPQRIYVYRTEKALGMIRSEVGPMAFNAPVVMLICSDSTREAIGFSGRNFGETDTAIVTTHMMLKAQDLGLGTCWIGWFDPEDLRIRLGLPKNIMPMHILLVGYAAEGYKPSKMHFERRPLSDTVTEL